jgi:D-beta-D-heptose 7-phosphate kinase/D-beta-D-heptose 1-phosphate adenosyltransferase
MSAAAVDPSFVSKFAGLRVLVAGDLMLDEYLWGDVHRISPEAPVPVVRLRGESAAPGGAGNAAMNVAALGGTPLVHGVIGTDAAGNTLRQFFEKHGISTHGLTNDPSRPTTLKTRIVAQSQQVVRADREEDGPLTEAIESAVLASIKADLDRADAVIISDYAKGLLTPMLVREVLKAAADQGPPVVVDPALGDVSRYQPVTILKLNHKEAATALGNASRVSCASDRELASSMGRQLLARLDARAVAITCGRDGLVLLERDGEEISVPAVNREVYDVSGAGDTVTATLALALAAGACLSAAALIANLAAGIVVGKVGTAVVSAEELREVLQKTTQLER